jgi:hypothetical protein
MCQVVGTARAGAAANASNATAEVIVRFIGTWSIDADDDRFDGSVEAAEMHGFPMGDPPPAEELLATMPVEDRERLRGRIARAWASRRFAGVGMADNGKRPPAGDGAGQRCFGLALLSLAACAHRQSTVLVFK